ncbi:MAG: ATP-binding cassette domain-containing protein [Verrucomicrobiae bacterium]|nr:ATP-binding cassette domain-containing protein [Verrucomicrobiae bacterium]
MIELKNVSKTFFPGTSAQKNVINNVSLKLGPNDFLTIIGSNGAGKTTLFNLISGSLPVSSGQILIKGKDVTNLPEYKRAAHIGRIFQDPLAGTASNMTLEDNMMITSKKGFKWPWINLNKAMREKFRREVRCLNMGLEDRMKDNVSSLSGGQRQALTLLMTVMSKPDILMLDEHTAALDPRNAAVVMEQTARFISEGKLTTLMITHNMSHAIEFGNRLVMMDGGKIIIDVGGEEKKKLTKGQLIRMFMEIKKQEFENDEVLLTA